MPKPLSMKRDLATIEDAHAALDALGLSNLKKSSPASLRNLAKLLRWLASALDEERKANEAGDG